MLEVHQQILLDLRLKNLLNAILRLIESNSLDDIKDLLESHRPEERAKFLTFSEAGVTPLFKAIKHERLEIARYFIHLWSCKERHEMCQEWKEARHPLTAALRSNSTDLVQLVAENMYNINDYIHGPFTPLIFAIFKGNIKYVEIIIRLGADVNIATFCAISPLMLSVFNSNICEYLLTKNVQLNHRDREGNTALHVAVLKNNLESLMALINAGADVRVKNQFGMSPLMLACIHKNLLLIMYLRQHPDYSEIEKIEALEVISACCVCEQKQVLRYWLEALKLRTGDLAKDNISPPQELLDSSTEFTTEDELKALSGKPLHLAFQGVLVIERILGKTNYMYLYCLVKATSIAKSLGNLAKYRSLLDHIIDYCQTKPSYFVAACSQPFKDLFTNLVEDGCPQSFIQNGGFEIFKLVAKSIKSIWDNFKHLMFNSPYINTFCYTWLVDSFLYMNSIIKGIKLPVNYANKMIRLVEDLVKDKLYVVTWQSLLHRVIKLSINHSWASIELIQLLLKLGADVEAKDYLGQTPMNYARKYTPKTHLKKVVKLLSKHGSNIESSDNEGALLRRHPILMNLENLLVNMEIAPEILEDFSNLHI